MVVGANGRLHDVDHHRAAVNDDPFPVVFTFHARLGKTGISDPIAHTGGQGLGLSIGSATGDDDSLKQ